MGSRPGFGAQEGAAAGKDRAGSATGGAQEGNGAREGERGIAVPAEIGAGGSVIPAGNALTRQIRALPGLGSAAAAAESRRERGHPRISFGEVNLSFRFSCSGLWECWEPELQDTKNPPFFSHSVPSPSFPRPSRTSREPLERGRRGAAGAWPSSPRAARAAPAGPGRWQAGHGTACSGKLLFCSLELLFQVSRASRGLWEREQPRSGGRSVQPSSQRAQGGGLSCSGITSGQAGLCFEAVDDGRTREILPSTKIRGRKRQVGQKAGG